MTPSKEALEASSAIVRSLGITDDRDLLAAIIDRHFAPLRQRAEQAERELADSSSKICTFSSKLQQAEARVKELESACAELVTAAKCDPVVYGKLKIAEQENELAALRAANAELAGALYDARLALKALGRVATVGDIDSVLARHASGSSQSHPSLSEIGMSCVPASCPIRTREQFDAARREVPSV